MIEKIKSWLKNEDISFGFLLGCIFCSIEYTIIWWITQ